MPESWKDVPGWEGVYQVSDLGRVRSLPRVDCGGYRRSGRVLALAKEKSGHLQATLSDGPNRRQRVRVHRLVMSVFVGPCPEGMEVRHYPDRDPSNNRLDNLIYGSRRQNALDKREHGTMWQAQRTHCPRKHKLDGPNLVASSLKHGRRDCLACNRARAAIKRAGLGTDRLQEYSDREYARLIR